MAATGTTSPESSAIADLRGSRCIILQVVLHTEEEIVDRSAGHTPDSRTLWPRRERRPLAGGTAGVLTVCPVQSASAALASPRLCMLEHLHTCDKSIHC